MPLHVCCANRKMTFQCLPSTRPLGQPTSGVLRTLDDRKSYVMCMLSECGWQGSDIARSYRQTLGAVGTSLFRTSHVCFHLHVYYIPKLSVLILFSRHLSASISLCHRIHGHCKEWLACFGFVDKLLVFCSIFDNAEGKFTDH